MAKFFGRYVCAVLLVVFVIGAAAPAVTAGSAITPAASRQNWDALIAAARKEGVVSIYAMWTPQTRKALAEAFKAKYNINVEFTPFSRGAEILAKVETEQRAGLYLADAFGAGSNTFLAAMKPAGVLGPLESLVILPEVTDGKNWSPGRVPFVDKDKTFIAMISYLTRDIIYNTDMIKKGEITDYTDVLKPQYKGKIIMNDPSVTGSGLAFMIHLAVNIWDHARARDYLTQLVGPQQAVIQRDNRIQVEEVARGKYAIGLAPNPDNMVNFFDVGAHLDFVHLKQGVRATSAAGGLAIPTKLAHPNAAKLFVNWLLTKEGQDVFSRAFGSPSLRTDVAVKGFNPLFLPRPGQRIFSDSEEFLTHTREVLDMTKQVIDATKK